MKHSKSTKAIALLMSMTMITSVFVGNTLSRYVTSVSSTDSARVAVWGINAGEDTVMNLFDTKYLVDGKEIAKANDNGDGTFDKIMAPGTSGEAPFSIINFEQNVAPEVAYEVKISLDDSTIADEIKNNPSVQWKLDNNTWGTWDELKIAILSLSGNAAGRHVYGPGQFATAFQGTQTHKIAWQWLMDNSNNVMDTEMGNLALTNDLNAVIKVSITAQQVDDLITNEYILDGADQTVNLNDIEPIAIRSSADFSTFQGVEVNDQPLTRDVDYTAEEGSTVITLNESYLSNLAVGTYTIDIISTDIIATTKFEVIEEIVNLRDNYEHLSGFIGNDGTIQPNNLSHYVRIPVTEGELWTVWYPDENKLYSGKLRYENSENELVSSYNMYQFRRWYQIDNNTDATAVVIKIPEGVSYMCVNLGVGSSWDYTNSAIIAKIRKIKLAAFGDSITARPAASEGLTKNYLEYISGEFNLPYINLADGGTGYAYGESNFLTKLDEIPDDVEYITIYGSFNDSNNINNLGNASDEYVEGSNNSIAAHINYTYDYIEENHPNAKVIVLLPAPWYHNNPENSTNETQRSIAYVNLLKEICENRNIPYLDLYHNSGMTPWDEDFKSEYYLNSDGVHPNNAGQKILAEKIVTYLKDIIK